MGRPNTLAQDPQRHTRGRENQTRIRRPPRPHVEDGLPEILPSLVWILFIVAELQTLSSRTSPVPTSLGAACYSSGDPPIKYRRSHFWKERNETAKSTSRLQSGD